MRGEENVTKVAAEKKRRQALVPRVWMGDFERDIQECCLWERAPDILETLLIDRTMTAVDPAGRVHRIRWGAEGYGFAVDAEIDPIAISKPMERIIRPRVDKRIEDQRKRSVDRAEVFTPSWVCNKQNNLVDQAWFGRKTKLFNQEVVDKATGQNTWQSTYDPQKQIEFPPNRTWEEYVCANRLEVACGEAPYLTSRYDTTTGDPIPVEQRIGFLDRKLRVISERVGADRKKWLEMAEKALKSCYGFEWQGDNVFLARENMLYAVLEAYYWRYNEAKVPLTKQRRFAEIISWNIWQMDGIKFVVPNTCHEEACKKAAAERAQGKFDFGGEAVAEDTASPLMVECLGCRSGEVARHNGIRCRIMDWEVGKPVLFMPPFDFKPLEC